MNYPTFVIALPAYRERAAKPERIVSMSNYGDVADKRWFARMSGKLYLITEIQKSEKSNQRRKK